MPLPDDSGLPDSALSTPNRLRTAQRLVRLGSPRFSSNTSVMSSTSRGRRFDERIRSRFSMLSQMDTAEVSITAKAMNLESSTKDLKWVRLNTLNTLIRSSHSRSVYGDPTSIAAGDIVALGTSKGHVLVFDYRQILIAELGKDTGAALWGSVTSLCLSLDSTHLAVGYESGDVLVWDLSNHANPKAHIEPLGEPSSVTDGHIKGSVINNIVFVGNRHTVLTTTDTNGMVMFHQCNRGVLGFSVTTRRILGRYDDATSPSVLACASLPLGTSVEFTDSLGLVAILNTTALMIISTSGSIRTQFKTGRPQVINPALGKSGCLAWFPAAALKDGSRTPAKLAYCFNNVLTILEVKNVGERLNFDSRRRWVSEESIIGVQWASQSVLALVSNTQQLTLLNEKTIQPTMTIDLLSKHLYSRNLYSREFNHADIIDDFSSSFKAFKGKLFFVGKYEVFIGSAPTWVDILLGLINEGRYIRAIEVATGYYNGNQDLEVVGLPSNSEDRHEMVLKYLVDVIKASAAHVLKGDLVNVYDPQIIREFLQAAIKALISIGADSLVFEELYEFFNEDHLELFFEALEPFILNGCCKTLTPVILKDMVKYYIAVDKQETLEHNICLLDIRSLDIDFTLSLLKKSKLRDSYTFIWNVLLHDYVTPFLELIQELQSGSEDSYKVYGYLAYILTGRQYPTEDLIPEPEAESTKLSIYFVLFNGSPIIYESGEVTINETDESAIAFPYLHLMAQYDSRSFLSAMNECLEDSLLNDDEIIHLDSKLKPNRQFIFEVLNEIFNNETFNQEDRISFAIFMARNYPKFHQFIRLSERTLEVTLRTLCSYEGDDPDTREDCELSLQSLLSIYQPPNRAELLAVFEKAGFNEILLNLYLNDRRFSKVLEVWLRLDKDHSIDTTDGVLEKCLKSTEKNPKERKLLENVIRENFTDVIESDTFKIVRVLNKYVPAIHKLCIELQDAHLKHLYLFALVQLETEGDYKLTVKERTEYVKCLGLFEKQSLLPYVKSLSKADLSIDDCIDDLRDAGSIQAVVYLLSKEGKYKESLSEVISYMGDLLDKLPSISNKEELGRLETDLWEQLQTGIALANHDGPQTQTTTSDRLSLNEDMWLSMMNFVVNALKKTDTGSQSGKTTDMVKRLLQDLFSSLINTRSQISSLEMDPDGVSRPRSSFLKIFTEFLSSSSVYVTVLGDVRFVTNEIYLALSYEKNILTITSKLISDNIFANMELLADKSLAGWSVLSFECEACGKIIWGRNLSSEAYTKWEERQRSGDIHANDSYDLVTFNCRHCYHRTCLENLGNRDGYHCVVCANPKGEDDQ